MLGEGLCSVLWAAFSVLRVPWVICIHTAVMEAMAQIRWYQDFSRQRLCPRGARWPPACSGCHISALLLVHGTAFPVALLYPQILYHHLFLFWVGWDFSPQNESEQHPSESSALRIKTNNAVPSALMSLSLFLLFRKWNALAPNPSQCWLGRAPLPMFRAH